MNPQQGRAQNNWRRNASSPPIQIQGNNAAAFNQAQQIVQIQQQQFMQQQQELYSLQQAQMEMQLQQLRLQNIEMQGRILAASSAQQSVAIPATANKRHSALAPANMNAPTSAPASQSSFVTQDQSQGARRDALQHLQRAQQHRKTSGDSEEGSELHVAKRPSRLSFAGGEGLAEHALARKRSGAFSPPATPPISAPAINLSHHRKTSSTSSGGSQFADRKHLSPAGGPTLVLSEPGDKYPMPTYTRSPRSTPLTVGTGGKAPATVESDASSPHSSDTDSNSEVASFESVTTVGSAHSLKPQATNIGKRAVSDSAATVKNLNPTASAFTPSFTTPATNSVPAEGQSQFVPTHSKRSSASGLGLNYPSTLDRSAGFRNFTAPPSMITVGAVATRQPKGPAKEDELESKNFGGRLRKKALSKLNRRSFVPPVAVDIEA